MPDELIPDSPDPTAEILRSLRPASGGIDRDAILFAAGRAAGSRGGRLWPALTALCGAVAVALGFWVWTLHERGPMVVVEYRERIVEVVKPVESPPASEAPVSPDYLSRELTSAPLPSIPDPSDREAWNRAIQMRMRRSILQTGEVMAEPSLGVYASSPKADDPLFEGLLLPKPKSNPFPFSFPKRNP